LWDLEFNELKAKSIDSHKLWIAAGRPCLVTFIAKILPVRLNIVGVFIIIINVIQAMQYLIIYLFIYLFGKVTKDD